MNRASRMGKWRIRWYAEEEGVVKVTVERRGRVENQAIQRVNLTVENSDTFKDLLGRHSSVEWSGGTFCELALYIDLCGLRSAVATMAESDDGTWNEVQAMYEG